MTIVAIVFSNRNIIQPDTKLLFLSSVTCEVNCPHFTSKDDSVDMFTGLDDLLGNGNISGLFIRSWIFHGHRQKRTRSPLLQVRLVAPLPPSAPWYQPSLAASQFPLSRLRLSKRATILSCYPTLP